MKHGQWSIVQQIGFAKMTSGMKNQAKLEEKRIETQRGIVNQFLKQRKIMSKNTKNTDKDTSNKKISDPLLEELLQTMLKLISQQSPISDDLLLICWKYEMSINSNEKNNRLWKVLNNIVQNVLNNSRNKRNWIWFKSYVLNSIVKLEVLYYFVLCCFACAFNVCSCCWH